MICTLLPVLVFAPLLRAVGAEDVLVEAEQYDRCHETVFPALPFARRSASGGYLAAVRGLETGEPNWLEYDILVAGGLYELRIRAGGNDSRQAGALSIDGGPPVTVLDEPPDALPLEAVLPAQARERSRALEETLREQLVGAVLLSPGRHRIRVQHAGLIGRSNAFGYDWIRLTSVERSEAPLLEVGSSPDPEGGRGAPVRRPVELHLLTSFRYWGPTEQPTFLLVVRNRERETALRGSYRVTVLPMGGGESAAEVLSGSLESLGTGQALIRPGVVPTQLPVGSYWLEARLELEGEPEMVTRAELVRSELNTPGWAKRARTVWNSYLFGMDLQACLDRAQRLAASGINVLVNANVDDWLGEEAISYPFRGGYEGFCAYLNGVHELGACLLMYHTMVTVSEHFYYEHKSFWGGRKPFYHCSWLSIYPDSPEWNAHQAGDFEFLVGRYPLDGIFLDNACAHGAPMARSAAGEEAIARHQWGLRAAIKRANPTGILYPNYNVLTPDGLRTVSRAWDAHMLEGNHPAPSPAQGPGAWTVRRFVDVASRVRDLTGKPFWPLMYAPDWLHPLCIAACGASRANPCGVVNDRYLNFLADIAEYIYSDYSFPAPVNTVTVIDPLTGEADPDPDLAVTALLRAYPPAAAADATSSTPVDWVIQVVNAASREGQPVERKVRLQLDLPPAELARPAWVLRPEATGPEPLTLSRFLDLEVGTWTLIIIAEELLPRLCVSPGCPRPVPGVESELQVEVLGWTDRTAPPESVCLAEPASWELGPRVGRSAEGRATLRILPPRDTSPQNRELTVALGTAGGRCLTVPVLVRMRPRVEVALWPDHFAADAQDAGDTHLRLSNHTGQPVVGTVRLSGPQGWAISPAAMDVSLDPGQTVEVPCRLTWPAFRPNGLYDLRDGEVGVSLEGSETLNVSIPVRLHASIIRLLYCPLGTRPRDVVRTGATPGGGFLSDIVRTVCGYPNHVDDAREALQLALARQRSGEQRMVLWFRTGGEGNAQLQQPEVLALLREFMDLGGGVILQENVFRACEANRTLLDSGLCPIGPPYQASEEAGGQWVMTEPGHPSVARFVTNVLDRELSWGISPGAQPPRVSFTVKPWATVVARNERGDPVLVVSDDPARRVAYLAGSLEGTYIDNRFGVNEYPEQMSHLLYFYAELARWLGTP